MYFFIVLVFLEIEADWECYLNEWTVINFDLASCYRVIETPRHERVSLLDAVRYCDEPLTYLLTINSDEEARMLRNL